MGISGRAAGQWHPYSRVGGPAWSGVIWEMQKQICMVMTAIIAHDVREAFARKIELMTSVWNRSMKMHSPDKNNDLLLQK